MSARNTRGVLKGSVRRLEQALEFMLIGLVVALVVIINAEVVSRFILGKSLTWNLEVSRILFLWIVFLGAGLAVRRGAYTAIELLSNRLPSWWTSRVLPVFPLALGALFIILGWEFASHAGGERYVVTGLPLIITSIAPCIFGFLMVLFSLANMFSKSDASDSELASKEYLMG